MESLQNLPNEANHYGFIYCTTNLVNSKKYIGYHEGSALDSYLGSGRGFKKALKEFGRHNFTRDILEFCADSSGMHEAEIYWIDYFGAQKSDLFYNVDRGGSGGAKGRIVSKETREKQALAKIGTKQSSETIEKRAAGKRGKKRPPAVLEKMRTNALLGLTLKNTPESLKRAALKRTGKLSSVARRVVQLDLSGKFIKKFDCISDATRELGMKHNGDLSSVLAGISKTSHGFKWMYLEDYQKLNN